MPTKEEIVDQAAEAATDLIFSHYDASAVEDVDVSIAFEEEELSIDIYLKTGAETDEDQERERRVADDAALAAVDVVDCMLEGE